LNDEISIKLQDQEKGLIVQALDIPDVLLLRPKRRHDGRGFFSETWHQERYAEHGIRETFVQDNHAVSKARHVLRGLHCQIGPNAQGKLVRVVRGEIWDVAVDFRYGSPTYRQHVGVKLSARNWSQLWVPRGFLHGYCTLTTHTEVIYKVTKPYDRNAEQGVIWNDPDLDLAWPILASDAILSPRDRSWPQFKSRELKDGKEWFQYD
jgi:dTDP-4-dehydrorhamnose 3,5-epimerase